MSAVIDETTVASGEAKPDPKVGMPVIWDQTDDKWIKENLIKTIGNENLFVAAAFEKGRNPNTQEPNWIVLLKKDGRIIEKPKDLGPGPLEVNWHYLQPILETKAA